MADPPAQYEVVLTHGAEQDLESIYDYLAEFDRTANANSVLDQLMEVLKGLAQFPSEAATPRSWRRWVSKSIGKPRSSHTV